jgi:hypothetical protein
MLGAATHTAFNQPPRGFAGLPARIAERDMMDRWHQRCPLCGGGDSLHLGACLSCLGRTGDRLVFVRAGKSDREGRMRVVRSLLPMWTPDYEVRLVADGHLALAAVPSVAQDRIGEAMESRGVALRSAPLRWAVASMPSSLTALLVLIVFVGILAAPRSPWMYVASPAFAVALWFLAQLQLRRPASIDSDREPWLSKEHDHDLTEALAGLAPGRAKRLLTDLVRLGRLLHTRAKAAGDEDLVDDTGELLSLASEVARDLSRMHEMIRLGSSEADGRAGVAVRAVDDRAHKLERLLLRATGALTGANRRLTDATGEAPELTDLIHEIDRSRAAYQEAADELEGLLSNIGQMH